MSFKVRKSNICILGMVIGIGLIGLCFQSYIIWVSLATARSELSQSSLSNPAQGIDTPKSISKLG
jgi:hypothetical protein